MKRHSTRTICRNVDAAIVPVLEGMLGLRELGLAITSGEIKGIVTESGTWKVRFKDAANAAGTRCTTQ